MPLTLTIIGRPNVGKSTLFNRLTRSKQALVDNTPGLTRDRKEGQATLGDLHFTVIDTAGLEQAENRSIEEQMMIQTELAMEEADILLMVIDGRTGLTAMDEHFAQWVRRYDKPTILIANKCEGTKTFPGMYEGVSLGLGEPVALSAEHGEGLSGLYDALEEAIQTHGMEQGETQTDSEEDGLQADQLQIAIAGRPNAGKSTLFNTLLGEERSIAHPTAGTTRDAIHVDWSFEDSPIRLVDTAGLRKKPKRSIDPLEKLSVDDSFRAIQYANVVILLTDATDPMNKTDLQLADHILNEGRGLVIAVNKWDLVEDKKETLQEIQDTLELSLSQAKGVPVITMSALNNQHTKSAVRAALKVYASWNQRISTGKLNRWLEEATTRHIPPLSGGKRIKLRYVTQVKGRPPTFAIFTSSNLKELPDSYIRYLTNSLRDQFGFEGVPLRILLRKGNNPYS